MDLSKTGERTTELAADGAEDLLDLGTAQCRAVLAFDRRVQELRLDLDETIASLPERIRSSRR